MSGYRLHPALLDAMLHLSAAALPPAAADGAAKPGATRIPAGLASVLSERVAARCQSLFPLAQPGAPAAGSAVLCNYKLLAAGAGPCPLQLDGLLAKEAGPGLAARAPVSTAARADEDVPASELLYEAQWQAVSSLAAPGASPATGRDSVFALGRPGRSTGLTGHMLCSSGGQSPALAFPALPAKAAKITAHLSGHASEDAAAAAVTHMLELWQRAEPNLAGGALTLATLGSSGRGGDAMAGPGRGAAVGAALWALARVAASENPGVAVSGLDTDPAVPLATAAVSTLDCLAAFRIILSVLHSCHPQSLCNSPSTRGRQFNCMCSSSPSHRRLMCCMWCRGARTATAPLAQRQQTACATVRA